MGAGTLPVLGSNVSVVMECLIYVGEARRTT